ncbi:MAG: hypothetical protein GXY85_04265 [Candidatus Brocadiaceae bacterium]|nr:hypothetical protein [Candidatus Brocadiaceae bacterium]
MKTSRRSRRALAWSVALAAVLAVACVRAAEPFENLMPEGVIVCVAARDVPGSVESVKASPQWELWSEPGMEFFLGDVTEAIEDMRTELLGDLGVSPEELLAMLGGQVCVGVYPRGDGDAHFLLLADVSGSPETAARLVRELVRRERVSGEYDVTEEEFRGHTIHHVQPVEDETAEEEEPEWWEPEPRREYPGYLALSDNVLAKASSPDRSLLERHLVLRAGETAVPSVGRSDDYRRLQPHVGADADVVAFVDIRTAAGLEDGEGASVPPALGLGFDVDADGSEAVQGLLLMPRPRTGYVRAFIPEGGSVQVPAFADADGALIAALHFSMPVLWEEIVATMQRDAPEAYMNMQQGLQGLPFNLENDIINALGDRVFFYMASADAWEERSILMPMALVARLRDAAAFGTAWKQILAMVPPMFRVETVEFMGVEIQQFGMAMAEPGMPMPRPCVAVTADKVVLASGLQVVRDIIRNDARSAGAVSETEDFRRLAGLTMEDPDAVVYANGQAMGRLVKGQVERQKQMMRDMGFDAEDDEMPDEMPWDLLDKYYTSSMLTARWTDDGLLIKARSLAPAAGR